MKKYNLHLIISLLIIVLLSSCNTNCEKSIGHKTGKYFQEVKKDITLPGDSDQNIIKLLKQGDNVIAVSPNKIFEYSNGIWSSRAIEGDWFTAAIGPNNQLWLGGKGILFTK